MESMPGRPRLSGADHPVLVVDDGTDESARRLRYALTWGKRVGHEVAVVSTKPAETVECSRLGVPLLELDHALPAGDALVDLADRLGAYALAVGDRSEDLGTLLSTIGSHEPRYRVLVLP